LCRLQSGTRPGQVHTLAQRIADHQKRDQPLREPYDNAGLKAEPGVLYGERKFRGFR
jgi:hypothetical protein